MLGAMIVTNHKTPKVAGTVNIDKKGGGLVATFSKDFTVTREDLKTLFGCVGFIVQKEFEGRILEVKLQQWSLELPEVDEAPAVVVET